MKTTPKLIEMVPFTQIQSSDAWIDWCMVNVTHYIDWERVIIDLTTTLDYEYTAQDMKNQGCRLWFTGEEYEVIGPEDLFIVNLPADVAKDPAIRDMEDINKWFNDTHGTWKIQ